MTAWIIAGILLAVVLPLLLARRQRLRNRFVQDRSPEHEAQITALTEWLGVKKIRHVIQECEGVPGSTLDGLCRLLGKMDEESLRNTLVRILGHRSVRRVIRDYHLKTYGGPHYEIMKQLAIWAGKRQEAA
jgi:hypothetical protein